MLLYADYDCRGCDSVFFKKSDAIERRDALNRDDVHWYVCEMEIE